MSLLIIELFITTSPQHKESSRSTDDDVMDPSDYLHLKGALIYLIKSRRISFVNQFRRYLRYLKSTQDTGLILNAGEPNRDLVLKCYVDASYLTHPDSTSHRGYCLSFGDIGSFYSKSSKQQLIFSSKARDLLGSKIDAAMEVDETMKDD